MTFTPFDTHMMTIALRLGERGLGRVAPNPAVGAVLADAATGEVLARGLTQPGGRPHAEAEALDRAGSRAAGKTLYVTLEPCCHAGRAGPCTDAIIAAKVARVVYAIPDPDARVSGEGAAKLKAAGVTVEHGLLADEARALTAGHILRVSEGRPLVRLKIACAADGSVPRGAQGRPTWVTPALARALGHRLRAMADAILVGGQTVIDDDPELSCRLPGMAGRSPIRVVVCGRRLPPPGARLLATARENPVWVVVGEGLARNDPHAVSTLEAKGARILTVASAGAGRVLAPETVLRRLGSEGVTRLLVEGGPRTWHSFAAAGCADEVVLYRAEPASAQAASPAAIVAGILGRVLPFATVETRLFDGFSTTRLTRDP